MKTCRKCLGTKALEEFHRNAKSRDGHGTICKPCQAAYQQSRKEDIFAYGLQYKYGISKDRYDQIFAAQDESCILCSTKNPKNGWCVDHDHRCCPGKRGACGGCVRGILCGDCNTLVGKIERLSNKSHVLEYLDSRI